MLLITHDLTVAARVADRVAVMLEGRVVETGPTAEVLAAPKHQYTQRLVQSVPGYHGFAQARPDSREPEILLTVRDVVKTHKARGMFGSRRDVRAVNGVSFDIRRGESVGIVGESGCGKSTLARVVLGLEAPDSGTIAYRGEDQAGFGKADWLRFRRKVQVVFQDPTSSFNPRQRVDQILTEPWEIHRDILPREQWKAEVARLLTAVGLLPEHAERYPHQFSGGQRQRIAIARALALRPEIIVCDEALSALDLSLRAQILTLLKELRRDFQLSYIFIAHDLPMVRDFCDRLHVMYRGKFIESGDASAVFEAPREQYTQRLLQASTETRRYSEVGA